MNNIRRLPRLAALWAVLSLLAASAWAGQPLSRIAFGSCAHQDRPQPIWQAVLAYRPDLFLFAGDNVYGDYRGSGPQHLAAAYDKARGIEGYARLRQSVPHLATWDDHDYGRNDAGHELEFKAEAQRLFADFWNLPPDDARRSREGVYHAQTYGPPGRRVQVVLLDTRYFRSELKRTDWRGARGRERYLPDDAPDKTMLGAAQWRWLEDRLTEPAELRLVVSSIQVLAEGHGWERWGNLPLERQRLFETIAKTGAHGVVFLSGDRHRAALYREAAAAPYPLHEITSSGLTQSARGLHEPGPNRLYDMYDRPNFGTIEVDWDTGTVTLSIRDVEGEVKQQHTLRLAELKP